MTKPTSLESYGMSVRTPYDPRIGCGAGMYGGFPVQLDPGRHKMDVFLDLGSAAEQAGAADFVLWK